MKALHIKTKKKPRVFNSSAAWHEIGGKRIYFRSKWEWRYALYLESRKQNGEIIEWAYEPKIFWFENIKRGVTNYKPDFSVLEATGCTIWVEVKGYMDSKSIVKLKRFKRYFPDEKIIVVTGPWFLKNYLVLSMLEQIHNKKLNDREAI